MLTGQKRKKKRKKAMLTFKQTAIIVLLSKTGLVNATA